MSQTLHPLLQRAYGALKSGELDTAEALSRQVLALLSRNAPAMALLARTLNVGGRVDEAWDYAQQAMATEPDFIPGLIEVAAIASRRGDDHAAARALSRLAFLAPADPAFRFDLAQTLLRLGDVGGARRELAQVERLAAGAPVVALLAAQCALAEGQARAALATLAAAPGLDHPHADRIAAQAHEDLGEFDAAIAAYRRALAREPGVAAAWGGYARTLRLAGAAADEVVHARRRALDCDPANPLSWQRYGEALRDADRHDEALAAFNEALQRDPDLLAARWCAFQYPADPAYAGAETREDFLARWRDGIAAIEQLALEAPRYAMQRAGLATAPTNFYLHYLGGNFADEQCRVAALHARLAALPPPSTPAPRLPPRRRQRGRRRIGIASPSLFAHTVSRLFLPLVERLPRERFEIVGLHLGRGEDAVTARWRALCVDFAAGERDPYDWSREIAAAGLDALVLPDVGMHPTPSFLAAQRLAPLQCVLWGHPVTTGSPHVDAFLSSALMEPADGSAHYVEPLQLLPHLGCVFEAPETTPDLAFADRGGGTPRFLVAQSLYKLTPEFDDALARIAAALPEARFDLTPACGERLRARLEQRLLAAFARHGLDGRGRIVVRPRMGLAQFLGLAAAADLNLDSFGWSGGNTTLEISFFDTPTLTLPGALMRSRHSLAINTRLELPELVADSVDDYVARAIALGRDAAARGRLRSAIAARKARLYRDESVAPALAEFLAARIANG